VIKRYRLHEVAERLAGGEVVDWPDIVLELGYSDQAHFIKDFKANVGRTPAEYAKGLSDIHG
jgi:AraC-like DNA-binding protein